PRDEEARRSAFGASAPYISPEQVRGAAPDIRSDVFSFGALLYHLTTGHKAFRGKTISEIWTAILENEPRSIWRKTRPAPRGMGRLIERCLRKNPHLRFQRFAEIGPLLEKMARSHEKNPDGKFRLFTGSWKRNTRIAGVALVATAAAAATAIWWHGGSTEDPAVIGSRIRQVTTNPGYDTEPAFSGDGSQLA